MGRAAIDSDSDNFSVGRQLKDRFAKTVTRELHVPGPYTYAVL